MICIIIQAIFFSFWCISAYYFMSVGNVAREIYSAFWSVIFYVMMQGSANNYNKERERKGYKCKIFQDK